MPRIFISYAKKDTRTLAESLFHALNALPGVTAWMDMSLEADSSWALQIQREIDQSDYVVVLLSPDVNRDVTPTQRRSFVLNEIDYAQQENKPILPVMVQATKMPVQLAGVQYINLTARPADPGPIIARVVKRFGIAQPAPEPVPLPPMPKPAPRSRLPLIIGGAVTLTVIAIVLIAILNSGSTPLTSIFSASLGQPTATFNAQQQLATIEAVQTQSAVAAANMNVTRTADAIASATAAEGDRRFFATETAAAGRILELSWTPTFTPTLTPLDAALNAARAFTGSNDDWRRLYPDGFVHRFDDGVPMALVPAGCFTIGANPLRDDERNGGEICFDEPYWIDQTEVTQADFERLGGVKANPNYFDGDQRPVERITWFEARDFCARRGARLLTEAEWEYAARGPAELEYPWGAWDADNAVWNRSSSQGTAEVGSIPAGATWVGALDMSGNVWEWTSSLYQDYPYRADDGREDQNSTDVRAVRGGSFSSASNNLRAADRLIRNPSIEFYGVGFRCARSSRTE